MRQATKSPPVTLTAADIYRAGEVFLNAVGASVALGHASPAGLADYVPASDADPMQAIVIDALSASRTDCPDAKRRVIEFADRYGLLDIIAEASVTDATDTPARPLRP